MTDKENAILEAINKDCAILYPGEDYEVSVSDIVEYTKKKMIEKTCKMLQCIDDYIIYRETGAMSDLDGCPEMDMFFDEEKYRKYIEEEEKMKTTEIMINDLFYVEEGDGKHIVKITSIDSPVESVRGIYYDTNEDTGWFSVDLLIPIVITEEILLSNDCCKKENDVEDGECVWLKKLTGLGLYDIILVYDRFNNNKWYVKDSLWSRTKGCCSIAIEIRYVHELQHILHFRDFDNIANNFKIK